MDINDSRVAAYARKGGRSRTKYPVAAFVEPHTSSTIRKRIFRRAIMLWYKLGKCCVDCGVTDPRVLEFDHVNGDKVAGIAALIKTLNVSLSDVLVEIEKCDLVCKNCHAIRTIERETAKGSRTLTEML